MTDINLTQTAAVIALEKHRINDARSDFPSAGEKLELPLQSADRSHDSRPVAWSQREELREELAA